MWKQLIQPHIDSGSQLWQPVQSLNLKRIEKLQQNFSKKIFDLRDENYWTRLQILKMNSQQLMLDAIPKYLRLKIHRVTSTRFWPQSKVLPDTRRGWTCEIAKNATARGKTRRDPSIHFHGARLFNTITESIQNLTGCVDEIFKKKKLDQYFTHIPDQPMVGDLLPLPLSPDGKHSNYLIGQVQEYHKRQWWEDQDQRLQRYNWDRYVDNISVKTIVQNRLKKL